MKLREFICCPFLLIFIFPSSHNTPSSKLSKRDLLHTSSSEFHLASATNRNVALTRSRSRRSVDPEIAVKPCSKSTSGKVITNKHVFKKEINPTITMSWLGKDSEKESPVMLLLTTFVKKFFFLKLIRPSVLYRSEDYGKTFQNYNSQIFNSTVRKEFGILKSPINPYKVILIFESSLLGSVKSSLLISTDAAKSFTKVSIPFIVIGPLIFHPFKENWILAHGKPLKQYGKNAYLSTDFGSSWKVLKSRVETVKWGTKTQQYQTDKETKTILLSTFPPDNSYNTDLWRSRDLGVSYELIAKEVYSFGIQGPFLFISVDFNKSNRTRIMHVSKDGGDTFEMVQVPAVTTETFYSIVDTVDGMVFLHVDEPGDTGKGTLYTSDGDGILFDSSLESHLYTNFDGVSDFYKVESMRGTYITQKMNSDSSLTTLITHDRGAIWHLLYLSPEQCKQENITSGTSCSLNIHGKFSKSVQGINVQGPLSELSAKGLIIIHGHAGEALKRKRDVWLTINGGYNWTKVLYGQHLYAFGDSGNVLVAVPNNEQQAVKHFLYSIDYGQCWFKEDFTDVEGVVIGGLTTEPGAKTLRFNLWGHQPQSPGSTEQEWAVYTIEFNKILDRKCKDSDLEEWTPHSVGNKDGCLLGYKEIFKRPKKDVFCYIGAKEEIEKKNGLCTCTLKDFECDYGFKRKVGSQKCQKNPKAKNKVCLKGNLDTIEDDQGYRLVPGDKCINGPDHIVKYVKTHKPCGKQYEYGLPETEFQTHSSTKSTKSHAIAAGICIPILILALLAGAYFIKSHYDLQKNKPVYSYSQLMQDEDEDLGEATFNPRPKGLGTYHDDSDSDDAAIIDL